MKCPWLHPHRRHGEMRSFPLREPLHIGFVDYTWASYVPCRQLSCQGCLNAPILQYGQEQCDTGILAHINDKDVLFPFRPRSPFDVHDLCPGQPERHNRMYAMCRYVLVCSRPVCELPGHTVACLKKPRPSVDLPPHVVRQVEEAHCVRVQQHMMSHPYVFVRGPACGTSRSARSMDAVWVRGRMSDVTWGMTPI